MKTMHTPSFPRFTFALTAVLIVLSTWTAAAQRSLERAEAFVRAGDWDAAHAVLAPEMDQAAYASNARAWFVLGFVQKEQFKASGASGLDAAERSRAVGSLQRALAMGTLSIRDEQTARDALDFLGRSYFREAIERVEGFTLGAEPEILGLMGRYESVLQSLNPAYDVTEQRADLHRYLGQAHANLLETERYAGTLEEQMLFDGAIAHYEASLTHAPAHYATLYNLAITLYNHGVRQLKRINHETSMFELMEIQDVCVGLFEQALLPMEQAHQRRPGRLETLKGLMTVHYALSQPEASDAYKRQIEALLQKK